MARKFQGKGDNAGTDYTNPHSVVHFLTHNPAITASSAVPIIGKPAGKNGVVAIAKIAATTANVLSVERFKSRPDKS